MPRSYDSYDAAADNDEEEELSDAALRAALTAAPTTAPSPTAARRLHSARTSDLDLRSRLPSRLQLDENSSLLAFPDGRARPYTASAPNTSLGQRFSRRQSLIGSIIDA